MFQKVSCNATNSGAIDNNGQLWVWGSTKYGLCGTIDPDENKKALNPKFDEDGNAKGFAIPQPIKLSMTIDQGLKGLDKKYTIINSKEFSAFNLLDPPLINKEQVYVASHVSYGQYHAGICVNDISTNYEWEELPMQCQITLETFEKFLLLMYSELEKQEGNLEIVAIEEQIRYKQQLMINFKSRNPDAAALGAKIFQKHHKASANVFKNLVKEKIDVPKQIKIEYMLRFYCQKFLNSTFPFIPEKYFRMLMENQAKIKISGSGQRTADKLFQFLIQKTESSLTCNNLIDKKKILRSLEKTGHWINLKEVRDQIMKRQCSNGKLFMFGVCNEGRLGVSTQQIPDSRIMHTMTIQQVDFEQQIEIIKVECGSAMTLALSSTGLMYSWGFGKSGSLGLGEKSNTQLPLLIEYLHDSSECKDMVDISCGSQHSLSIDTNGKIYSWGNGQGGRLGHNQETGENAPRQIMDLADKTVRTIEAGDASSVCILTDFSVYMWGSGMNGRLGNGTTENVLSPIRSAELDGKQCQTITKGTNNTFAILDTGQVFGFGSSKAGKLGFVNAKGRNYELPRLIISLSEYEIYQLAAGPFHTILLTTDGKLLSMGNSKDGKLGYELIIGNLVDVDEPQMIKSIPHGLKFFCNTVKKAVAKVYKLFEDYDDLNKLKPHYFRDDPYEINQVACGYNFQIFLTNNGQIYSTGSNKTGQLGIGNEDEVGEMNEEEKEEIIALGKNDAAFIPGHLQEKIIDLQQRTEKNTPMLITIKSLSTKVKFVAVGSAHAIAIMNNNNTVFAWGKNKFGECGQSKTKHEIFVPSKIKAFGTDSIITMAACGENHTIFLMGNNSVQTCGSNEFGQLGLISDAPNPNIRGAIGGQLNADTPTQIEKSVLDHVIFVACGRYHTFVIVKEQQLQEEEEDEPEEQDHAHDHGSGKKEHNHDTDHAEKDKIVDSNHQIFAWGRGYHGQLGIRQLLIAQWVPKRIKIIKDPKLKDEEQPSRYKSITCGEKHTIILAINGKMLYSGDKTQVGFKDPNEGRKNMYEQVDESGLYQKEFVKYFDPHEFSPFQNMKFQYVKSNINSKTSFAINQQGKTYQFGHKIQFQECMAIDHNHWGQEIIVGCDFLDRNFEVEEEGQRTEIKWIAGDIGRDYKSMIAVNRMPYCWGDVRYGKCGIDFNDKSIKKNKVIYDRKNKKMLRPYQVPFFKEKREEIEEKYPAYAQQFKEIKNKFNKIKEEKKKDETKIEEIKDLKFPIQKVLKNRNQDEYEQLLIQQDIDLLISFKTLIEGIHDDQKKEDRKMRQLTMNTQDCIISRVLSFPKQIPIIEDINTELPKIIVLNKQVYECLWTYLQTHPCYLINWITGAIKEEIDLFDDHPLSFLDEEFFKKEDKDLRKLVDKRESYLNYSEQHIEMDEYCFLITAVFGGMKQMRNDRRIINMLMIIAQKVFDFEINESISGKISYTYDEIVDNHVECAFIKLHRQIFQLQFQNLQFVEELFEQIVRKLFANRRSFVDGLEKLTKKKDKFDQTQDVFDYESVISNDDLVSLRGKNLINFLTIVFDSIFMLNFDKTAIEEQKTKCKHFFSDEIMMITLKAYYKLKQRSQITIRKLFPGGRFNQDKAGAEAQEAILEDQICKFIFRLLFEDLILRLQNCQPHDIIRIYGQKIYGENPILNIIKKRNNFYFIGVALRQTLLGNKIYFSEQELDPLRKFTSCVEPYKQLRFAMMEKIKFHISIKQINCFEQILIKQTIEQSIEIKNENLTIPLRNIVYVHNQLVRYGEIIYCKGFQASPNVLGKVDEDIEPGGNSGDETVDGSMNMKGGDVPSGSDDDGDDDDDGNVEMDPIKTIMTALGMQFIILKVYRSEFITQVTLNATINMKIQCRIFENFREVVRCNDCNALVWEGMISKKRFKEGIRMKQWQCTRKKCGYYNQEEMSLACGGCGGARPKQTFPQDLMFPLYVPIDTSSPLNNFTVIFQSMLQLVDLISIEQNFHDYILRTKKNEQEKLKLNADDCDFNKISIISEYEQIRQDYIDVKKKEQGFIPTNNQRANREFEDMIEDKFTEMLCQRIQDDLNRKSDHEEVQRQNQIMIQDLYERIKYIKLKTEDIHTMMQNIQKYARYGIGNIELLDYAPKQELGDPKVKLFAGKLVSMQKHISSDEDEELEVEGKENKSKKGFSFFGGDKKKKKKPKKEEDDGKEKEKEEKKTDNLNAYFESMDKKLSLQMTQARLQRKLDENRQIRNLMKTQFGQFKSYSADELIAQGIIDCIKLGEQHLAQEVQIHCKYLFYELKNENEGGDGGYKVELSHEQKIEGGLCGIQAVIEKANDKVKEKLGQGNDSQGFKNDKNQSILSSFEISNETIMEMRRIMTTKCTVCLEGTTFNIFKLTQLFNKMKSNNKQILEVNVKEKLEIDKGNDDDDEDGEG